MVSPIKGKRRRSLGEKNGNCQNDKKGLFSQNSNLKKRECKTKLSENTIQQIGTLKDHFNGQLNISGTKRTKGRMTEEKELDNSSNTDGSVTIDISLKDDTVAESIVEPLPGRTSEFEQLNEKIGDSVALEKGCCIYVSGVPGTGKTATLRKSIGWLKQNSSHPFDYFEINGMKLLDAGETYSLLWRHIQSLEGVTGKTLSATPALKRLGRHFEDEKKEKRPLVLLLDELDLLLKKNSSLLYHFFEWTGWPHSKLVIVAIANTMDLPERFLSNKVASRMGTNRINFKPYTYPQLMTIIMHNLDDWKQFLDPNALEYCARKVSAVSGDARRALNLATRTIEWLKKQQHDSIKSISSKKLVTISMMEEAIQRTFTANAVRFVEDCSFYQKVLLLSLHLASKKDSSCITFERILSINNQLLRIRDCNDLNFNTACQLMTKLCQYNIISVEQQNGSTLSALNASSSIKLQISVEELITGLKNLKGFESHLVT